MLEVNKIYQGDCLEVMKAIDDKSIDMILCDLPYGITACEWDTAIPFKPLWEQYKRVIKDRGSIVLTASQPFTSTLVMSNIDMFVFEWVWVKNKASNFQLVKHQPLKLTERVLVFRGCNVGFESDLKRFSAHIKERREKLNISLRDIGDMCGEKWYHRGGKMYFETGMIYPSGMQYQKLKQVLEISDEFDYLFGDVKYNPQGKTVLSNKVVLSNKNKGGRLGHLSSESKRDTYVQEYTNYPSNVLYFNCESGLHPTQKPVSLFEYLIKTYTNEGDLILDNCIGSGTTAIACLNSNRRFIGIEKELNYVDIANERIRKYMAMDKKIFLEDMASCDMIDEWFSRVRGVQQCSK